jgi:hypothetical protein
MFKPHKLAGGGYCGSQLDGECDVGYTCLADQTCAYKHWPCFVVTSSGMMRWTAALYRTRHAARNNCMSEKTGCLPDCNNRECGSDGECVAMLCNLTAHRLGLGVALDQHTDSQHALTCGFVAGAGCGGSCPSGIPFEQQCGGGFGETCVAGQCGTLCRSGECSS